MNSASSCMHRSLQWREGQQQKRQKACWVRFETRTLDADLGMANVEIAIRFRREAGPDLPASCLEVSLQLSGSVGNAHLSASRLRTECHHLVHLPHTLHKHPSDTLHQWDS